MRRIVYVILFILLSPLSLQAQTSQGLRCSGDLVVPGYFKFEVIETCGQPLSREFVGEVEVRGDSGFYGQPRYRNRQGISRTFLYVEEWIYDRQGLHVLRFEGNRLVAVESIRPK